MYHPAFKVIGPVRAALAKRGVATVFNKLGPLLNPASPSRQLAGVFEPGMTAVYAEVFRELGREKAWAVHGETPEGGMDEMSTFDDTQVVELNGGRIKAFSVCAQTCAIHVPTMAELRGGSAAENAAKLEALLRGKLFGPIEDLVCWNAAGALVVAGVVPDLKEGLYQARSAISGGKAVARLDALRRY
jgi:anthranilate phosphoribosyltransferase